MSEQSPNKKPNIWMPLYVGDYLADTGRLTTEMHGAYLLLLMDYWITGKPLPDDDEQLGAITKLGTERFKMQKHVLMQFFCMRDACWVHGRVEEELAKARAITESRSKAARAKWAKNQPKHASADASADAYGYAHRDAKPMQNGSPSQSHSINIKEPAAPEIPPMSRKDFDAMVDLRGYDKKAAEFFWNKYDALNWLHHGQPIRKVEPMLKTFLLHWREKDAANNNRKQGCQMSLLPGETEAQRQKRLVAEARC